MSGVHPLGPEREQFVDFVGGIVVPVVSVAAAERVESVVSIQVVVTCVAHHDVVASTAEQDIVANPVHCHP